MKIRILFFLSVLLGVIFFPASSVNQSSERNDQSFDDCITIDGRTYKVSPAFSMPAGIDKDSPVKLLFSNESHELLSIEQMTDDNTNSDQLEYHFGIVNAISPDLSETEISVRSLKVCRISEKAAMEYRYKGNFKADEVGYSCYRPEGASCYFYTDIFPGEDCKGTGLTRYRKHGIRVRIIPYSSHSVVISGWDGVFDILPFNSGYAVLDNEGSGGKPHRKALLAMADIRRNFLEIKE